jgi:hypothetical protein
MAVTVRGDRGAFGAPATPAQASPLRLGALPAYVYGPTAPRLGIDANGNVTAGFLSQWELPSQVCMDNVAETIWEDWTFDYANIIFAGGLGPPLATSRSLGTRIVWYALPASTEYATGMENGALWQGVPAGTDHKWYTGATERLRLNSVGALLVINGDGRVYLSQSGTGVGTVEAASTLALQASGAITVSTGAGSNVILPGAGYKENLGQLNKKFLTLHAAELWVETLVAQNTMATIGGRVLIGPTTTLMADLIGTGAAEETIQVKHNQIQPGDFLWLEANGQFEIMQALYTPGGTVPPFHYIVARNLDGSGVKNWYAGQAVFNTGTTGAGFIDLYSVRGVHDASTAGPTITGNVRTANAATAWEERWAVGNLKGLYGNGSTLYGAAFGHPTGGLHVQIDATNGIRFMDAANTPYSSWDMTGAIRVGYPSAPNIWMSATGNLELRVGNAPKIHLATDGTAYLSTGMVCGALAGTVGIVRSNNASAFNAGQGFYFEAQQASGTARALIGNSAGRRLQWDGASLKLISDGVTIDEDGITMLQYDGTTAAPGRLIRFGTGGAYLWDTTSAPGQFHLIRQTGNMSITAQGGTLSLGGAGLGQVNYLQLDGVNLVFTASYAGSGILPDRATTHHLGSAALRWNEIHGYMLFGQYGMVAGSNYSYYFYVGADAAGKPTSGTWTIAPSDRDAKEDIRPVDRAAALALVRRVPLVHFRYNGTRGGPAGAAGIGVIAQDVEPLLPASVTRQADGGHGWNPHELLMLNVAAVQALADRLDDLERTPR